MNIERHGVSRSPPCSQPAADNCAKMKKGELAAAAAERMAGRGWLPPALVIAEPEPEAEDAPAPFADGDGDGDDEEFENAEAA